VLPVIMTLGEWGNDHHEQLCKVISQTYEGRLTWHLFGHIVAGIQRTVGSNLAGSSLQKGSLRWTV